MASETKERILDVAERLFADRGFAATSTRDITGEAGVNLAAVNYHFGSKEALLESVLERRFRPINENRIALLDELERAAGREGPDVEDILRALLGPPFSKRAKSGTRGQKFLKLLGHLHTEINEEIRLMFVRQSDQFMGRFTSALERALPHLEPDEVMRRMSFVIGAMALTMTWGARLGSHGPHDADDPQQLLESLVRFAAAGLAAPVSVPVAVHAASKGGRA